MLLRSLPVHKSDELVTFDGPGAFRGRTFNRATFSYPMYRDFRDKNEVLAGVIARFPTAVTFTLNEPVSINGHPMTIVGVVQKGFNGVVVSEPPDVLVPVMMKAQMTPTWNDLDNRFSRWLSIIARVKPGVSLETARAAMNVLYSQINAEEIKQLDGVSERFRKLFLAKKLIVEPAGRVLLHDGHPAHRGA